MQLDGGLEMVEDFLPLELGSADVILGIQWLEKLGVVRNNWKTQIMEFKIDGKPIILKGDPTLVRSKISLKAMLRTLKKPATGIWWSVIEWSWGDKCKQPCRNRERPSQVVNEDTAVTLASF